MKKEVNLKQKKLFKTIKKALDIWDTLYIKLDKDKQKEKLQMYLGV